MRTDPVLKWITLILVVVGFLILASASVGITTRRDLPSHYFILRQLLTGGLLGFIALIFTSRTNYKIWKKIALPFFIGGILLTAAVFIPGIGFSSGGATRWIV